MSRRWNKVVRIERPQQPAMEHGICASRSSARRRVGHARLQPALGDCKNPGGFARGKGFVKAEYSAIAAVTLGTMDREGGTKAATVGRVCRGRNDVLAHGNADVWNLIHSGSQAWINLREPARNSVGCSSTVQQGDKVARGRPARGGSQPSSRCCDNQRINAVAATRGIVTLFGFWPRSSLLRARASHCRLACFLGSKAASI